MTTTDQTIPVKIVDSDVVTTTDRPQAEAAPQTLAPPQGHLRLLDLTGLPAEQGMRKLIDYAVRLRASDLFLVTNEQHVAVQVRYLGLIEPLGILERDQGQRYIAYVRAGSSMDVNDHRRPQDGRWLYPAGDAVESVDLRISVVPTRYGEDLAIRLLLRDPQLLALDRLGMSGNQLETYRAMLDRPGGMILLTGPTGSGKTVTLYASLACLNDGHRKIHTIEDPIEYAIDGLRQSQVNTAIDLGPAELLRGVLRQSPDVVMVGEIRDAETAEAAVCAANSGVLVLATLHAPSASGAIQSLRGFGVGPAFIATSLRGIVSARLLRTLCPECRQVFARPDEARRDYQEIESLLLPGQGSVCHCAGGCERCYGTGYSGRVGAFEVMPISDALSHMILKGRSAMQIRTKAVDEGLLTLRQAALLKAAQGLTTMDEVRRVIPDADPPPRKPRARRPAMHRAMPAAAPPDISDLTEQVLAPIAGDLAPTVTLPLTVTHCTAVSGVQAAG